MYKRDCIENVTQNNVAKYNDNNNNNKKSDNIEDTQFTHVRVRE